MTREIERMDERQYLDEEQGEEEAWRLTDFGRWMLGNRERIAQADDPIDIAKWAWDAGKRAQKEIDAKIADVGAVGISVVPEPMTDEVRQSVANALKALAEIIREQ